MSRRPVLGCLVALLLLIGVGAIAATILRPDITRFLGRTDGPTAESSVTAAESAEEKLRLLMEAGQEVRLTPEEAASLFDAQLSGWIPAEFRRPGLGIGGDTLFLHAAIPTERLPTFSEMEGIRRLLPDTAQVEIAGHLGPFEAGSAEFDVVRIRIARIPVPVRYYPAVLDQLGRRIDERLGPTSVLVPLPHPMRSARVEANHLVLTP